MRFDALLLTAFGPFTGRDLDLAAGAHGVHVIHGPNEAGKSSALRAVKALLFGVPERTTDGFVHDNKALRIGAVIRPATGEPFTCFRRKGRKNTLLDGRGEPLAEGVLDGLLQGIDEARFGLLFGIDHHALTAGGQELLAERGREAEALFGSGLGSSAVHGVLDALDAEAQGLFAPRGQKRQTVNALLGELDAVRRELREAALPARRWDEARRERDRARGALDEAERALDEARTREQALRRLQRTLPGLAELADMEARLAALADAPVLGADFGDRRRAALEAQASGQARARDAARRVATLEEDLAGVQATGALLDEADAVDALHRRLGARRAAEQERPELAARRTRAAAELEGLLATLTGTGAGSGPARGASGLPRSRRGAGAPPRRPRRAHLRAGPEPGRPGPQARGGAGGPGGVAAAGRRRRASRRPRRGGCPRRRGFADR